MDDLNDIESENERCLSENRALRSKLQFVKENSSLRVANILAEVLTWIDQSAPQTDGTVEGFGVQYYKFNCLKSFNSILWVQKPLIRFEPNA